MTVKPSLNVRFDYGTAASDVTGVVSNATLGPRGQGTSFAALKSYKIKLSDTATKWKDQKTLNLNKHPYDITKVRNKLAFDLMKMFPDTFSLRTQFCHLYIRDLNSSNKGYVDYGLFTQVEEPNKDFLESRGIEKTAYFYKAESFRFETYPDVIKNVSDPAYNKTEFEKILGIEGTEEHSRLIAMLKDVNDETQDINAVIDKWFDRDNYVTWMAMNLLIGNTDTVDSNFFLLSPVDQEKWYFVPWDYDYSLGSINAPNADNSWMAPYMMDGISLYWGISMHRRFLEDPDNLAAVTAKLEELSTIATKAVVTDKVSKYYASTHTIVNRLPDTKVRDGSLQVYENEIKRLSNVLDDAKQAYYDGFAKPMPVVTKGVQISGGQATFTWEQAYKFDNDTLHYAFTLSSDPDFNNIIDESTGMLGTSVVVNSLPAGTYYWKVEVYDPSGNRTISVDNYYDVAADAYYFGVRQLIIK
jgi:spore coat protein H